MSPWLERVWLERYLERELSPEESHWFEAYMLDKPELLDAVEADTDLRDGLARSDSTADVAPGAVVASGTDAMAARSGAISPPTRFSTVLMPMAAMLVVGIGLGLLFQRLPDVQDKAGGVIASPTRVVYDTMRGEALEPRVEPGSPGTDAMLIEVGMPPTATDITVRIGDGPELPLVLSPDGFVSFVVSAPSAPDANLHYVVDGVSAQRTIRFPRPADPSP